MKLGVIGLPSAGKTTIFNALTRGSAPTGQSMAGRFDVLTAVVDVPDSRVDVLSGRFKPKKTTYARVTYTDVAGLKKGIGESGGLRGPLMNHLTALDGFVHVVRAFEDESVPHVEGLVDPARDLVTLDNEFMLADLVSVEGKIERIRESFSKGSVKDRAAAERELALFERLHQTLSDERPLRELDLDEESLKSLRSYGFLTLKPVLVLINIGDDQGKVALEYPYRHSKVANLRGRLEMELAQLNGEDLEMFMAEYGITELGLDRVIHLSYDLLGLQSFFTVNEEEVRAWTLKRGATALDAAGTVHTDMAKGFIRAEVIHYDELVAQGGLAQARAAGKLRLEGKTYVVQEGEVVHIKFNL